jgi:hypothetical protein
MNMGMGLTNVMREDVSGSKHMVDKQGIMTKERNLVHLQVFFPPKHIWSMS